MQDLLDMLKPVYTAFASGRPAYAAAMVLVVLVAAARKYGASRIPFLHSDLGGSLLALLGSFGGALVTALAIPGATVTTGLMWTACTVAVAAAGGYSLIKRLLVDPVLRPLAAKAPAALQPVFQLVFWIFDGPDQAAAKAAGDAAVKAKPGAGLNSVTGKPTNVK